MLYYVVAVLIFISWFSTIILNSNTNYIRPQDEPSHLPPVKVLLHACSCQHTSTNESIATCTVHENPLYVSSDWGLDKARRRKSSVDLKWSSVLHFIQNSSQISVSLIAVLYLSSVPVGKFQDCASEKTFFFTTFPFHSSAIGLSFNGMKFSKPITRIFELIKNK